MQRSANLKKIINIYKSNLFKLSLVSLLNALAFTVLIPIFVEAGRKYGLSDSSVAILFGITAFGQFVGTPILGDISDRIGRKPVLLFAIFGTIIASLLASISPTAMILYVSRFIDGITGGNSSIVQAVASDLTDKKDRIRAYSYFGAMFGVGIVVGPLICALSISLAKSWEVDPVSMVFGVSAFLSFLSFLFVLYGFEESLVQNNKTKLLELMSRTVNVNSKNKKLVDVAYSSFKYHNQFTTKVEYDELNTKNRFLFFLKQPFVEFRKNNHSLSYELSKINYFRGFVELLKSVRTPIVNKIYLLTFVSGVGLYIFTASLTQYAKNTLELNATNGKLSLILAFLGFVGVASQYLLVWITKKQPLNNVLFITFLFRAVFLILLGLYANPVYFVIVAGFLAIFNNASIPLLGTYISLSSSPRIQGINNGINTGWFYLASIFGSGIASFALKRGYPGMSFLLSGFFILIATVLTFYITKPNFKLNIRKDQDRTKKSKAIY